MTAAGDPGTPCVNCEAPLNDQGLCDNAKDHRADLAATFAERAFWAAVAKEFPEIKSGDFPPNATVEFERACNAAVREWLLHNDFQRK